MILGLDASTRTVGISILEQNGRVVQLNYLKLAKWKTLHEKGDQLRLKIEELKSQYEITEVYIEEYAQKFTYGRSSASTITRLAAWNGITQYICWDVLQVPPQTLNVTRARKIVKIPTQSKKKAGKDVKQQVFEWVSGHLKYDWPTKILQSGPRKGMEIVLDESYDMCDAWVIAKAGYFSSGSI